MNVMGFDDVKRLYEDPEDFQWYGYQPLLSSFGTIVIQIEDDDWQGDSRILYKDGEHIGFLMFGWGSCSGCDAFYGCDTFDEAEKFAEELESKIMWFGDEKKALAWFKTHDWAGDYSGRDKNTKLFVKLCIEYLSHKNRRKTKWIQKDLTTF